MLKSIFYGNGINRVTLGMPSWNDLIKEISNDQLVDSIPNTLKYEAIILGKPYRQPAQPFISKDGFQLSSKDGYELCVSGQLTEKELKDRIANRVKVFPSNVVYDRISKLPVMHFITTNYDNTLFKSLGNGVIDSKYRIEKIYSIRRHYIFNESKGNKQYYWPIHGNIDSPASIMLGFDHYCGSLTKVNNYVKGNYEAPDGKVDSMVKRINQGVMDIVSWIDLFFISDIHIIGTDLSYEETDLWWVLNKRSRINQAYPNLIQNKIVYYPVSDISDDKRQLLARFGVEINEIDNINDPDFQLKYIKQLDSMENIIRGKSHFHTSNV